MLGAVALAAAGAAVAAPVGARAVEEPVLAPASAVGVHVDTLLIGGYARGSFAEAMHQLAAGIPREERDLVGGHLDRIFAGVLDRDGLGGAGRLRLVVERTRRPDGSARGVRVLSAEAAVGGTLHTAYYFEREGSPGYYDPSGRSLEAEAWAGPLRELRITSPFGRERLHPILRRVLPHAGVDYAARTGTPVHATADGIVSIAATRGGYGKLVEIRHPNGYSTRYAHLSGIADSITPGTPVRRGQTLGAVGMTGLATGPHLHYEVRRDGRPVDPARVAAVPGMNSDLAGETGWAVERQRLARLLARTPTIVRMAGFAPAGDG